MTNDTIHELKRLKKWVSEHVQKGISEASAKHIIRRIERRVALLESSLPVPSDFENVPKKGVSDRMTKDEREELDREWVWTYYEEMEK
jgi:hypothetical protein